MQVQVEKDGQFITYGYDPEHIESVTEFYEKAYQDGEIEGYIIARQSLKNIPRAIGGYFL